MAEPPISVGRSRKMNSASTTFLGNGAPMDFAKGVSLLRSAAGQGEARGLRNYTAIDYTSFFNNKKLLKAPALTIVLQQGLAAKGFLPSGQADGQWTDAIAAAIDRFKAAENISDKGVSLRVLDRLGVVDALSLHLKRDS